MSTVRDSIAKIEEATENLRILPADNPYREEVRRG